MYIKYHKIGFALNPNQRSTSQKELLFDWARIDETSESGQILAVMPSDEQQNSC
jgi:hypothetical protein